MTLVSDMGSVELEEGVMVAKRHIHMTPEQAMRMHVKDNEEVFVGRDFAHAGRSYGDEVADQIDREVKRIIDECYQKAKQVIEEHRNILDACAQLLLEKEKITGEEFEALFYE